jgi:DNA-binding MarR family transcriptional regulator
MNFDPSHPLADIYSRLGFLVRRAHQISVSIFNEECAAFEITPPQYGVLTLISRVPGIDQISVSRLFGFDRSTTALIVSNLVKRDLVSRAADPADRRRYSLQLTAAGNSTLAKVASSAKAAQDHLAAPFSTEELETLLSLLGRLNDTFNAQSRTLLDPAALSSEEYGAGEGMLQEL